MHRLVIVATRAQDMQPMDNFDREISWIDTQQPRMERLIEQWCSINSYTYNLAGVDACAQAVAEEFAKLGAVQRLPVNPEETIDDAGQTQQQPLAQALSVTPKHPADPGAPRVLLNIHLDTVYAQDHPFQQLHRQDGNKFCGPGVADAKGGIVVMLIALEALLKSKYASRVAWEVLLNTDEEIGSRGSLPLLQQAAARNDLGMLYEPSWPDGQLTGMRKGAGRFSAIITGRAAHAGRDPGVGRNAMNAAARFVVSLSEFCQRLPGASCNVGRIDGGGPVNIVPDLAIVRFNLRVDTRQQQQLVEQALAWHVGELNRQEGFGMRVHGKFTSPPRPVEGQTLELFQHVASCGKELGMDLTWRSSGGVSDGNKLAAAGLPNVDTLGVRGGNLHTPQEYMLIDSLTQRAKLSALLLFKLASGQIQWKKRDEQGDHAAPGGEAVA